MHPTLVEESRRMFTIKANSYSGRTEDKGATQRQFICEVSELTIVKQHDHATIKYGMTDIIISKDHWHTVFIENANGKTTEIIRYEELSGIARKSS